MAAKNPRLRLNLKMIATVDFRCGVPHHYDELKKRKLLADLKDTETVLLVSATKRQLAFVFLEVQLAAKGGDPVFAISHYRIQLSRHSPWNPIMLAEYAALAGIELIGIKRFDEHLKSLAEAE